MIGLEMDFSYQKESTVNAIEYPKTSDKGICGAITEILSDGNSELIMAFLSLAQLKAENCVQYYIDWSKMKFWSSLESEESKRLRLNDAINGESENVIRRADRRPIDAIDAIDAIDDIRSDRTTQ